MVMFQYFYDLLLCMQIINILVISEGIQRDQKVCSRKHANVHAAVNNGILLYVCTDHNELKHTGAAEMAPVIDYMEVRYYANQNSQ